ncbi:MAG TPA: hypothetical protein VME40_01630 [Caulobacteraceae bacterium]|nr:hypothetical protein [Caulobacteraceae bacterium]
MAAKYARLGRHLRNTSENRIRLSFKDVETILGFDLPKSARTFAPWWANDDGGSHVQAQSWMQAGWRTRDVDVRGEQVTFERASNPIVQTAGGVEEPGVAFVRNELRIDTSQLSVGANRVLSFYLEDAKGNASHALELALDDAMVQRRRRLISWFRDNAPTVPGDSTEIIREARDAR